MHLIERYALGSGAKIDKPYILEKFFPHDMEKYITLHPRSKFSSKCYDFWQDVIDIIHEPLSKNGIDILQIGTKEDPQINKCRSTQGTTSIGQAAYLIRNSLLHLGVDSFPIHIASSYNKKMVALYSNIYPDQASPYWGEEQNQILLEPDREGKKPSYAAEENPKSINSIKPEEIAKSVLSLLGIDYDYGYVTVTRGPNYLSKNVQSVPHSTINIQGLLIDSIIMRMDLHFDENILANQLLKTPCSILTNKPISLDIIKKFKDKIKQIVYLIEKDNHDPKFIEKLIKLGGVRPILLSEMDKKELNEIKLDYMDHNIILPKGQPKEEDIDKIKSQGIENLYYKSNKFLISRGKIYPSIAAWHQDKNIEGFDYRPQKVIDDKSFWQEIQDYYILKKEA